jgi:DNA-binding NtrC family response regulator
MQILLVDDDAGMLSILAMLLGAEGHEVDTCECGDDAIGRLRDKAYGALLTDLIMPGMSGLDLVREARALHAGLRCVIISGQEAPAEAERGGATWVLKPLDLDALLASLVAA